MSRSARSAKWMLAVAVLVGAILAAPWLIPSSAWLARVESEASLRLGAPVRIGALQVTLLPLPHVVVRDLSVANGAVAVQRISVYPRLLSLLSAAPALRSIELDQVRVTPKGTELLQAVASKPQGAGAVALEHIRARQVQVELASGTLPALDADVEMDANPALGLKMAKISTQDGKAKLSVEPDAGGWKLVIDASNWQMPLGPPLRFERLQARGRVTGEKLDLGSLSATLYGGTATGKADLMWQKGWRGSGEIKTNGIDVAALTQSLKIQSALSGKLDAAGPFRAQAAKPAGLMDALQAEIAFEVRDGMLHGFDLASAAQSLLKSGAAGGSTRFDQLTGVVRLQGRAVKLQNVQISSGVLKAQGNVDISASKQLAGRIDTEVKGTAGLVGVPLAVSGTLDSPVLLPTKGSMAGAVIGSVLLPGVGTSIGSSVGDKIGKMFGK